MAFNIVAVMLGIIFQILVKMIKLQKLFKASNKVFVAKNFLKDDAAYIALSFVSAAILFIVFPEIVKYKPWVGEWQRLFSTMSGAMGAWAISQFLSFSQKKIINVIDEKTNKADNI